ncbi:MAG: glycosyltransferase family 4 protein [Pseudomonadales bacterium]|nr:glycosyltransferase family 4 protein [Pseudomonadales bacterium]
MKVWLVTVGEPLPTDAGHPRLFRTGQLARKLVEEGHEVLWWTSTFDHSLKQFRRQASESQEIAEGYRIHYLHGPTGYQKNVSLARIFNHRELARDFLAQKDRYQTPDIVVCSYPVIELAYEVAKWATEHKVPVVLDVRDMWPDIFANAVPAPLRLLARIPLFSMERMARATMKMSSSLVGITQSYLDWACNKAARSSTDQDHVYHLTSEMESYPSDVVDLAERFLSESGVDFDKTIVSFVGIISERKFCLNSLMEEAVQLQKERPDLQFVFAGNGDDLNRFMEKYPELRFLGWIDGPQMQALLAASTIAVAPYWSSPEFMQSIPIKIFDYMANGVPVINCLRGEVESLIAEFKIGIQYSAEEAGSFSRQLIKLIDSSSELEQMALAAKETFVREFSPQTVFSKRVSDMETLVRSYKENPDDK